MADGVAEKQQYVVQEEKKKNKWQENDLDGGLKGKGSS